MIVDSHTEIVIRLNKQLYDKERQIFELLDEFHSFEEGVIPDKLHEKATLLANLEMRRRVLQNTLNQLTEGMGEAYSKFIDSQVLPT